MTRKANNDPLVHTRKMQGRIQELIDHLHEDIDVVDEPQLRAMFETAAEVLAGVKKTLGDYELKKERAWR